MVMEWTNCNRTANIGFLNLLAKEMAFFFQKKTMERIGGIRELGSLGGMRELGSQGGARGEGELGN